MIESISDKAGILIDALKWAWLAIVALVLFIFNGHRKRLNELRDDVTKMKQTVIYRADLDAKAEEIKAEVKEEHQRIIDEQKESNRILDERVVTCNQNVMAHIATMQGDVREVRTMLMSLLERRQSPR